MKESSESENIERAIQGDLNAFNRLVCDYQSIVYNSALRIMNDPASADDIAQTAFISAWQHMGSFKGSAFKPWILRITINACYDELRRLRRKPTTPLEPLSFLDEEENEDAVWMIDPTDSPADHTDRKEEMNAVKDCLERLSDEYRTVMVLIDIQEMNYQEAADIIGKPLGTIKSRLLRARLKMRDCLNAKGELFK